MKLPAWIGKVCNLFFTTQSKTVNRKARLSLEVL
jgi:hypothetical protein